MIVAVTHKVQSYVNFDCYDGYECGYDVSALLPKVFANQTGMSIKMLSEVM